MAKDTKYGQIEIPGIPEDEPVFVIRAKDVAAVPSLRSYAQHAMAYGASLEFVDAVSGRADEFSKWQGSNKSLVKTPD